MKMNIQILEDCIGQRVDVAVSKTSGELSRTQFQKYIKQGSVSLDGKIINDPSLKITSPCLIEISNAQSSLDYFVEPENIPLDVVFEDEYIIIINKPAGMVCHPAPGHRSGTLVNAIVYMFGETLLDAGEKSRPGIVHRLDKDTSGLMIVAKTNKSHVEFAKLFSESKGNLIRRKYTCFVFGSPSPKKGQIETMIKRHPKLRQQFIACYDTGKFALTMYSIEKSVYFTSTKAISKVICELLTGRTHQIRIHMQHIGNPIIGDIVYGKRKIGAIAYPEYILSFPRQALHSSELSFKHPMTGENLKFTSELPDDMEKLESVVFDKSV
ncbi:MAG: RluA family pseudouridine synthase [Holosporales bacterium]|jgi:23S rRNA pseudouridine1911/1915/1917 synthase|nr:RluA family pseudouridine synthase [Holosporales bacterium]